MSYEMNAEGVNGVQQTTYLVVNETEGGWIEPPAPPDVTVPDTNGSVMLFVDAKGFPNPILGGVLALGNNSAPGVVGQCVNFAGPLPGAGVAGYNVLGPSKATGVYSFNRTLKELAGVYGECDGGPGVKGRGGNAVTNPATDPGSLSFAGGTGVLGVGGESAGSSSEEVAPGQQKGIPAQPAGAGVIGVGGGAAAPEGIYTFAAGVIGMGGPAANGFGPGRGGVFGSAGNIAQLRLTPAPGYPAALPATAAMGDIYLSVNAAIVAVFVCVEPDGGSAYPARWVQLAYTGGIQLGGSPPKPVTY